jgi:hypothetical protein
MKFGGVTSCLMKCSACLSFPVAEQALERARAESRATTERVEAQRALREGILAAERDKARSMATERALRGQRNEEELAKLAEVEAQRRRKDQHSLIDYRYDHGADTKL